MSQFFILKGFRRRGIGRSFAHALFDRFSGKWEVGYIEQNTPAVSFWNAVVFSGSLYSPTLELLA